MSTDTWTRGRVAARLGGEAALAMLERLFEASSDAIMVCGPDGRVLLANRAYEVMFGGIPGERHTVHASPTAAARGLQQLVSRAMEGERTTFPIVWYGNLAMQVQSLPLRAPDGRLEYVVFTIRDETAREEERLAEAALRRSEERLRDALIAGRMFTWEADFFTNALNLSDNAASLLGVGDRRSLLRVDAALSHVHPDDIERLRAVITRAVSEGRMSDVTFRWIRPVDGKVIWLSGRNQLVRGGAGVSGFYGLCMDITELKEAGGGG